MTRKKRRTPTRPIAKEGITKPAPGPVGRFLAWVLKRDLALVVVGGAGLGMFLMLGYGLSHVTSVKMFFLSFACCWLVGVFLAVCAITEAQRKYARSGGIIRTACGAAAAAGIFLLAGAPLDAVLLAAIVGGVLGSLSSYWARYL